jgi:hypothetical protein
MFHINMHGCKLIFLSVFICFKRMFQLFHLDVAYIFAMATHVFFWCFERMLQVFHLDVAKVDLVLHMLQWNPSVIVHAHEKRRDGKQRGMAAGARPVPACVCSRSRAIPSVTRETS